MVPISHARVRSPMVCLEGPSAVGKTRLAAALAEAAGAAVIPEVSGGPPAGADPNVWFVAEHARLWARAMELAAEAPLVVLDGDPFKGLWYHWIFAAGGAPTGVAVAAEYGRAVARDAIGFPDLYVVLGATETQLRERQARDATRRRRNFEAHLRLVAPQRRYFAALEQVARGRVLFLETADREGLVEGVMAGVATLSSAPPDAAHLLRAMARWVAEQPLGAPAA